MSAHLQGCHAGSHHLDLRVTQSSAIAVPQASERLHIPDSGMKAFQNLHYLRLIYHFLLPPQLQPNPGTALTHSYVLSRLPTRAAPKALCSHGLSSMHLPCSPQTQNSGLSRSEHEFLTVCLLHLCSPFFLQPTRVEKDGFSTSISFSFLLEALSLKLDLNNRRDILCILQSKLSLESARGSS